MIRLQRILQSGSVFSPCGALFFSPCGALFFSPCGALLALALVAFGSGCVVEPADGEPFDYGHVDSPLIEEGFEVGEGEDIGNPEPQPWRPPHLGENSAASFDANEEDDDENPEPQPWAAGESNPEPQPWMPNPDEDDEGGDDNDEGSDDDDDEPSPVPWVTSTNSFSDVD